MPKTCVCLGLEWRITGADSHQLWCSLDGLFRGLKTISLFLKCYKSPSPGLLCVILGWCGYDGVEGQPSVPAAPHPIFLLLPPHLHREQCFHDESNSALMWRCQDFPPILGIGITQFLLILPNLSRQPEQNRVFFLPRPILLEWDQHHIYSSLFNSTFLILRKSALEKESGGEEKEDSWAGKTNSVHTLRVWVLVVSNSLLFSPFKCTSACPPVMVQCSQEDQRPWK